MASADEGSPAEPGPLPSGDGPEPARTTDGAAAVIAGDGTVIGWTRGAEALLGYPAAEVVGRSAALLLTGPRTPGARPRSPPAAGPVRDGAGWSPCGPGTAGPWTSTYGPPPRS
ncbi:hypothetical protein QPM16_35625 [Streptomyces anulatus]|nr:hypothetical protein [Streptomyces anulatus]WIY80436.1 hypothetical protein QPM16_35625 [Streptomyces anulatus]